MPNIQLPKGVSRVFDTKARLIVLIGGRSSAKSESIARILLMYCQTQKADILCGREFMNSIEDSVHKLLKELIRVENIEGFSITDRKIDCSSGGGFRFKGFNRNPESVKSAQNFKYSWVEEAQNMSQASIDDLLPTIRATDSKLFFTANPQASGDPFSQRFIIPFQTELDKSGYYEDDMHLIIKLNYDGNPWHGELEKQRLYDFKHMSRAKYDWVWEGAFLDDIEDAIISADWFDACIDAHLKIPFKIRGAEFVAHDPSDLGEDVKGLVHRHGSLIKEAITKDTGDVNEGGDWAADYAIQHQVDYFLWDGDGIGLSMRRQFSQAFHGRRIEPVMFRGSKSPERPDDIYEMIGVEETQPRERWTNLQTFKNRRSQRYWMLRDRIYNTYLAVTKRLFIDEDKLISFSSGISELQALRSEVCRIPRKPNPSGLIQIMPKPEMKRLLKINSPNLADSLMMSLHAPTRVGVMLQAPEPEMEAVY